MTKKDLTKKIQESLNLHNMKEADDVLDKVVAIFIDSIKSGEEFQISGLGKFEVRTQAERECRNPQTGEKMKVPAKKVVKFKPAAKLKELVNEQ